MEAKQTPLIELLERVPQDARLVVEHDQFSSSVHPVGRLCREAAAALRAALAQEQEQKQKLLEAVRVRIMSTAYDCADDGEVEAYNSVKVLCTELLEMLK